MRIIHLIFALNVGGAENLLVDIANRQIKNNNVTIVIVKKIYNENLMGRIAKDVSIICLNKSGAGKFGFLIAIAKLWKLIFKYKPDVIHCHDPNCIRLLSIFKKISIITVHGINYNLINIKKYQQVYAISDAVKLDMKNRANIESKVVYNGIPFRSFRKRENFDIEENGSIKIVLIGRLVHLKGHDILLDSLPLVLEKLSSKRKITIDFIGEGENEEMLRVQANNLKLAENVNFVGVKDRKWIYENLANYHILVQPSRHEGFGLTVLEGVAAKIPVIAFDIDAFSEILKDLPSCILAPHFDIKYLANIMVQTIENLSSPAIRDRCDESYKKAESKFSIETTSSNYEIIYKTLKI